VEEVKGAVDLREREEAPAKAEAQTREVVKVEPQARGVVPAREEAWEGSEVARAEHASAPIAATKSPINRGPPVSRFNVPSADEPWLGNRSDSGLYWNLEDQGNNYSCKEVISRRESERVGPWKCMASKQQRNPSYSTNR
jgi:hypothetical protein